MKTARELAGGDWEPFPAVNGAPAMFIMSEADINALVKAAREEMREACAREATAVTCESCEHKGCAHMRIAAANVRNMDLTR